MKVVTIDMEMPISCKLCDLREPYGVCSHTRATVDTWKYTNTINGVRHESCPLHEIEIPDEIIMCEDEEEEKTCEACEFSYKDIDEYPCNTCCHSPHPQHDFWSPRKQVT